MLSPGGPAALALVAHVLLARIAFFARLGAYNPELVVGSSVVGLAVSTLPAGLIIGMIGGVMPVMLNLWRFVRSIDLPVRAKRILVAALAIVTIGVVVYVAWFAIEVIRQLGPYFALSVVAAGLMLGSGRWLARVVGAEGREFSSYLLLAGTLIVICSGLFAGLRASDHIKDETTKFESFGYFAESVVDARSTGGTMPEVCSGCVLLGTASGGSFILFDRNADRLTFLPVDTTTLRKH